MITLAIPKGRLFEETVDLLFTKGIIPEKISEGRKLNLRAGDLNLLLLKPFDIPLYVESGVSDLGICGLDVILEKKPEVYRFIDLGIGRCRISVAGRREAEKHIKGRKAVRIATKYPSITREFMLAKGINPEIIEMSGSVEIGAVLNVADLIVDLVQTGKTLKENGLVELEVIQESTAWLICNRASFRNKREEIIRILQALRTP